MASSRSSLNSSGAAGAGAGVRAAASAAGIPATGSPVVCSRSSRWLSVASCMVSASRTFIRPSTAAAPLESRVEAGFSIVVPMTALSLQWNQAVLFRRPQFPLGLEILERLRDEAARQRGLDNVVHQPAPRGDHRIGERLAILFDHLLALGGLVLGLGDLLAEYDFGRTLGAHDR